VPCEMARTELCLVSGGYVHPSNHPGMYTSALWVIRTYVRGEEDAQGRNNHQLWHVSERCRLHLHDTERWEAGEDGHQHQLCGFSLLRLTGPRRRPQVPWAACCCSPERGCPEQLSLASATVQDRISSLDSIVMWSYVALMVKSY
jgi:hypothetical protein